MAPLYVATHKVQRELPMPQTPDPLLIGLPDSSILVWFESATVALPAVDTEIILCIIAELIP